MSIPYTQPDNPTPPPLPSAMTGVPKLRRKPKRPDPDLTIAKETTEKASVDNRPWLERFISRQGWIGMGVSFLVHGAILLILAFIVMSTTSRDTISVMGLFGDADEVGGDVILDTTLPIDPGDSSMDMADMSQSLESLPDVGGLGGALEENIRVGFGGTGGDGQGGEGEGIGVAAPTLRIPSHAQTKGSFSAWTDPRDPKPNENYSIVIQIRLPEKIKKYRGSDLTGTVTGTDRYKQTIRFRYSEQFPVEDGLVEIRIPVPGGGFRVRDTIRIESKLLKEKQTFEIEF